MAVVLSPDSNQISSQSQFLLTTVDREKSRPLSKSFPPPPFLFVKLEEYTNRWKADEDPKVIKGVNSEGFVYTDVRFYQQTSDILHSSINGKVSSGDKAPGMYSIGDR